VEYISSSGSSTDNKSVNLLGYGAGSSAWSFTLTPTYQVKNYFVRGELSYVKADSLDKVHQLGFGSKGTDDSQAVAMVETGFLF
jgi:hypothetical protein